jgi:eukaryotic-like serine/threonine-protein kinase
MSEPARVFAALERCSPAERAYYLDLACEGNPALRQEIEALFKAQELDALGNVPTQQGSPPVLDDADGTVIGPYKLRERIGEGGMGTVYVAEQERPVRRKVALKIVKPGMDTRQVVARFDAERQALALMDHPHIAKVLDAGATEAGRPYFVMELVRGVPITEYCRRTRLPLKDRLALFIDVCHAVQHAHQKGIIHRDLKPSNVLVGEVDGRPTPKVIDFGIAKATGQVLTEFSLYTGHTQLIGTPQYMSPEQTALSGVDVDTRSDVYSLGVLLYELLTGATPVSKETLAHVDYDELRRIIREDEPPRPSTRLTTQAPEADLTRIANHPEEVSQLRRQLRGALDWIVMQALEKDRNRRYQSASDLAADVQRYLRDEPIDACPPTPLDRVRRYVRRHKALVAGTALVLATALVGTGVSLWYAREAFRSARLADAAAAWARSAQTQAEQHAWAADEATQWSQTLLYTADMKLVSDALANRDVPRAAELLRRHLPAPGRPDLRGFEWHYFHKRITVPHRVLAEPGGWIDDMALSRDGVWLAATAPDGGVNVYEVATGTKQRTFQSGVDSVDGLAWAPDGQRLAAACSDGCLCVWEIATGALLLTMAAHPEYAADVVFSPDGRWLYSCGGDAVVRQWDAETGAAGREFPGHERECWQVAVSPDGRRLASASGDRTFAVWETDTGRLLHRITTDDSGGRVACVAFSPDGRFVAAGNIYGAVHLLETDTGTDRLLTELADGVEALAFLADGRWLATGDRGGALQLHAVPTNGDASPPEEPGQRLRWAAHEGRTLSLSAGREGRQLISGGRDGCLRVWRPDPDATRWRLHGEVPIHDGALADDDRFYLAGRNLSRWDLATRQQTADFGATGDRRPRMWWLRIECSRDGRWLIAARHKQLALFDLTTHEDVNSWTVLPRPNPLAISSDGRWVAAYEAVHIDQVTLYERGRPDPVRHWPALQCAAMVFSPDARWLAAGRQNDVLVYSVAADAAPQTFTGHSDTVSGLAFSPDGELLASVSQDRMLKVWRHETGELLYSLVVHPDRANSVDFSPDGRTIATAGRDGQVKLWHTATGQPLGELPREQTARSKVRFSRDGRRLMTLGEAPDMILYDATLAE